MKSLKNKCLAILLWAVSGFAWGQGAPAGNVIFASGEARIINAAGVGRDAVKGMAVTQGDTLVTDTVGFNEKQWAVGAYPNTSQMHMIERISRPNLTTITYEYTVDDPGAYTKPWGGKWTISQASLSKWIPNGEMFEYICQDSRY